MAQINKDKKQSDNQRISSLTQENDNLFQSADIEQSKKDLAKAVVNFAQQVINAEGFTGRDLRLYNLGIQEAVNKILKGELAYSESMTGDARTNIFGYYSRFGQPSELDWMINETVKRGSKGNIQSAQSTPTMSAPIKQIVNLSPASGFSSYVLPSTTIDQKVKKFAQHLSGQLNNYLQNPYDESLYIIKGINKDSIKNFLNYVDSLGAISGREATAEDILALGDIVSALGNEDLTNAFESYFAKELASSEEQQSQTVENEAVQQVTPTTPSVETSALATVQLTTPTATQPDVVLQNSELLSKINDVSDKDFNFIGSWVVSAPLPFVTPVRILDIVLSEGQNFKDSLLEFVKLYVLAENGDIESINKIKTKFKRISEKHGLYASGDEIIQELKRTKKYQSILKQCLTNTTDAKEQEILLKELLNPRNYGLIPVITNSPSPKTYFSSSQQVLYPHSHRTYSEKKGGKLDKLQNYINSKNGK